MNKTALRQSFIATLLAYQERGFTFGYWYRQQAMGYLVLFVGFGAGMAWWSAMGAEHCVWLLGGAVFGIAFRDYMLACQQKHLWPFMQEFMDWNRVKQAAGQSADDLS
jgi:hypothetical protein